MTIALAVIRDLFEGAVGVTTRKYSECMTSWTKHVRAGMSAPPLMVAARVAGRRHVSDVPRASVYWGLSRTPQSTLRRPTFHSMAKTAHALRVIRWCRQGLDASDESIPSASVNYSVSEIRLGEVR